MNQGGWMIGATGDQLTSEEMAQTASLRYSRRSAFRNQLPQIRQSL